MQHDTCSADPSDVLHVHLERRTIRSLFHIVGSNDIPLHILVVSGAVSPYIVLHPIMADACATCASFFGRASDPASEKALLPGRYPECCGRSICSRCLNQNNRYETYCPYCQITTEPSLLPQGLRDPPAYSSLDDRTPPPVQPSPQDDELPAYSESQSNQAPREKKQPHEDVLHFLKPDDSLHSLSLAYGVPMHALRKANNVFSDHLIQGRKTVIIPGEYYSGGVSVSPQPLESEEEELKKNKTRRWMMACKVAEYVALRSASMFERGC